MFPNVAAGWISVTVRLFEDGVGNPSYTFNWPIFTVPGNLHQFAILSDTAVAGKSDCTTRYPAAVELVKKQHKPLGDKGL